MRLLIISDTHIPVRATNLPVLISKEIDKADYLVHAGDFISLDFLQALLTAKPFAGVAGNNDPPEIAEMLGFKRIVELSGFKLGIVHGHMGTGRTTLDRALSSFPGEKLDILVFGHSHIPYKKLHGGTWVINPGSPTDRRRNVSFSFCSLELEENLEPIISYF